jgi:hypothetical protein
VERLSRKQKVVGSNPTWGSKIINLLVYAYNSDNMEWIAFVKKENVAKAEGAIRDDTDFAAKESITVRDARVLDFEKNGSFFLISGTDEGVERCKELIKEFVEETPEDELNKAREKIKKEGEKAAEGFGGLFG